MVLQLQLQFSSSCQNPCQYTHPSWEVKTATATDAIFRVLFTMYSQFNQRGKNKPGWKRNNFLKIEGNKESKQVDTRAVEEEEEEAVERPMSSVQCRE